MAVLEALLAFALIMLVMATIASILVETALRILKKRERDYERMMHNLFADVIWPRFRTTLESSAPATTFGDAAIAFMTAMKRNAGVGSPFTRSGQARPDIAAPDGGTAPEHRTAAPDLYAERYVGEFKVATSRWQKLLDWLVPTDLAAITPAQFAERLAGTEVGRAIAGLGRQAADDVVKDLAQKLENYASFAGAYYARRAKTICMVVALALAFVFNVDGLNIFSSFVADEAVRHAVLEKQATIESDYREKLKALREAEFRLAEAAKGATPSPAAGDPLVAARDAAKLAADEARLRVADLARAGVPLGWERYPGCSGPAAALDRRCASVIDDPKIGMPVPYANLAIWLLSVGLTGLLIGLGGPFWYDTVQSLSQVLQLARALGGKQGSAAPAAPQAASSPPPAGTEQPRNPVEAFRAAAAASIATLPPALPRRVLGPLGT